MTKAERKALEWFAALGVPVAMFGAGDPSLAMVKRLHLRGLVNKVGREQGHGPFGFTQYAISAAGLLALSDAAPQARTHSAPRDEQ